jgi:hypothetical protein
LRPSAFLTFPIFISLQTTNYQLSTGALAPYLPTITALQLSFLVPPSLIAFQPPGFPALLPLSFIHYPFAYGCVPNTISNQSIISVTPLLLTHFKIQKQLNLWQSVLISGQLKIQ